MRDFQFILSKQALIVFLVFLVATGALLGVPGAIRTLAGTPPPVVQDISAASANPTVAEDLGNGWTEKNTPIDPTNTPSARVYHTMAALPGGDVLLFGGADGYSYLNDTWLFDVATNTWSQITGSPSTPSAHYDHAMAALPSGDVLLFGGFDGDSVKVNDTWLFNSITKTWSQITSSPFTPPARNDHAMATTPSGVLLFGGFGNGFADLGDTWLFNTATNSWSQVSTPTAPSARFGHTMAALPSGDVLLFGGANGFGTKYNDTWLFNTATNTWGLLDTGSVSPSARFEHAMTATPSGDLLLFGGYVGTNNLADTWLFNTTTNTWGLLDTGSVSPSARWGGPMATTPSGALLFGGYDDVIGYLNDTWLYGPIVVPPTHTVTYSLQPNWNMISLPVTPTSADPNVVFGGLPAGWVLYAWDAVNARYLGKSQIVLGLTSGYWLKVSAAVEYPVSGLPNEAEQTEIALGYGWNLIGVPYEGAIPWEAVEVSMGGGAPVSLDQAINSGWIHGTFYRWGGDRYQALSAGGSFQPLWGYWVRAKVPGLRLLFNRP